MSCRAFTFAARIASSISSSVVRVYRPAATAVVRAGEVELLMKGSLHTDELLHAVLRRDTGIRTERRLSHCFSLAVPISARPFILTDAAINIAPDLMAKRDILVVPDLEAGNMLAKQLTFMNKAEAAGIVAGARVPIILTSRADSVQTRLASCAVAALLADAARQGDGGRQGRRLDPMTDAILVINAGSSSIKFAAYSRHRDIRTGPARKGASRRASHRGALQMRECRGSSAC